jgi:hypothetical protein
MLLRSKGSFGWGVWLTGKRGRIWCSIISTVFLGSINSILPLVSPCQQKLPIWVEHAGVKEGARGTGGH